MKTRVMIKSWMICCFILSCLPASALSQQWQGLVTVDSRAGYSTNNLLNPFYGAWDQTSGSGYGLISSMGQLRKLGDQLSADITAGGVYEPFFNENESLRGGFGLLNLRYRFNSDLSAGVEAGGSNLTTAANRQTGWFQPMIAWSPTPFSQIRFKAGSTFRGLPSAEFEGEETTQLHRYDQFGFEFETWPRFNWQIRTGWYGNLDDLTETMSLQVHTDYLPVPAFRIGIRVNADQYQFTRMVNSAGDSGDSGGAGGPPFGGPRGGPDIPGEEDTSVTVDEKDRIFRAGISLDYQVHRSFALIANADRMALHSSASGETFQDYQFSAGLRIAFRPSFGNSGKAGTDWQQDSGQTVALRINYSGEGQLYITGDFNDWEQPGIPLTKQSSRRYVAQLSLEPGAYEYKILLKQGDDESWIDFSDDTYTVKDGFGGTNGLVFID